MLNQIKKELKNYSNSEKAKILQSFFKTGKGEYGEGDIFIGVKVPEIRATVKKYHAQTTLKEIQKLLNSKIHEHRLTGLLILVKKYEKTKNKQIFNFYLKNIKSVNNWDLVDLTAPNIAGDFFLDKDKSILYKLAKSKDLWEKRVSIISTFKFIRNNQFKDTLKISEILINDKHDLIHKAVGWMLREIGKRNIQEEEKFLKKHYKKCHEQC